MARHVGRPTNEEVAARKRKQMLKILIPGGLVALAVVMIIGSTGLRGLMGASVSYCNPGDGNPDSDNMCTSTMDARLLGDVNGDSQITQADADLIKIGNFESASIDFAAADVNQDGKVSIDDATIIENFLNGANTTTTATEGNIDYTTGSGATTPESVLAWNEEYVCPVDYSVDGTTCIKKYNAIDRISTGENKQTLESTGDGKNNQTSEYIEIGSLDSNNLSIDETEYNIVEMDCSSASDTDEADYCFVDNEEVQNPNNNSTASKRNISSTGSTDYAGWIYIINTNSKTNLGIQNQAIYKFYRNQENCKKDIFNEELKTRKIEPKLDLYKVTHKGTNINITKTVLLYRLHVLKNANYVRQYVAPAGYKTNSTCYKVAGKLDTRVNSSYKDFEPRIAIKNNPISYKILIKTKSTVDGSVKKSGSIVSAYYDKKITIVNKETKLGYRFDGWTVARNFGNTNQQLCYTDSSKKLHGWVKSGTCKNGLYLIGKKGTTNIQRINAIDGATITLNPKWSINSYSISYRVNGGKNNASNPAKYNVTTNTITLKNPTRSGYTFKGWYSDSKYKTKVTQIKKGSTGNKTLYAKWSKKTYTIKYNLNGGKNNASNPAKYNVTTNTITLKNPTRSGYTFKGWYSDSKYKTRVTQIKKGSTGNKTLYAKWSKK